MQNDPIYVAIGSNIDPHIHVPSCIKLLAAHDSLELVRVSSFYESPADGRPEQPNYRNGVVQLISTVTPHQLKFDILRKLEEQVGRIRTTDRYAPRTIDLDIVLFGAHVIEDEHMKLPDPAIWLYPFVTIPLLEIAPELQIPGTHERLVDRVRQLPGHNLALDAALTQTVQKGFLHG